MSLATKNGAQEKSGEAPEGVPLKKPATDHPAGSTTQSTVPTGRRRFYVILVKMSLTLTDRPTYFCEYLATISKPRAGG